MLDLFRRKLKTDAAVFGTSSNAPPPSYHSTNTKTLTIEKTKTLDSSLDTGCPCHPRYHLLKSSIEGIHSSYLAMPTKTQKRDYVAWASWRIGALLGIVRTTASPCAEQCMCHDGYKILKSRLERDEAGTGAIRTQTQTRDADLRSSYERWNREVHYLRGMLIECLGKVEKGT